MVCLSSSSVHFPNILGDVDRFPNTSFLRQVFPDPILKIQSLSPRCGSILRQTLCFVTHNKYHICTRQHQTPDTHTDHSFHRPRAHIHRSGHTSWNLLSLHTHTLFLFSPLCSVFRSSKFSLENCYHHQNLHRKLFHNGFRPEHRSKTSMQSQSLLQRSQLAWSLGQTKRRARHKNTVA